MAGETEKVYLGLGSNLGDRVQNIEKALHLIVKSGLADIFAVSRFYETEAELYKPQPDFLNCAAAVRTGLSPYGMVSLVKKVERRAGRRKTFRYGPRLIDIDILLYGSDIIEENGLTVPHPGLAGRLFALFPLAEIAGDAIHPAASASVKELLTLKIKACRNSGRSHG